MRNRKSSVNQIRCNLIRIFKSEAITGEKKGKSKYTSRYEKKHNLHLERKREIEGSGNCRTVFSENRDSDSFPGEEIWLRRGFRRKGDSLIAIVYSSPKRRSVKPRQNKKRRRARFEKKQTIWTTSLSHVNSTWWQQRFS